ncbi:MAG TPA: hypothetical protein VNB24_06870, partial [Acidimicrobiales bacterium]|nr:hypothetical protein [Acidimicrobiales bacterium]
MSLRRRAIALAALVLTSFVGLPGLAAANPVDDVRGVVNGVIDAVNDILGGLPLPLPAVPNVPALPVPLPECDPAVDVTRCLPLDYRIHTVYRAPDGTLVPTDVETGKVGLPEFV